MNIKNVHDKFIKQVFSDRDAAIEFFSKYLDREVIDLIDINSIEYVNGSYINEEITELFTDMIFRVKFKDKEEFAFICLLLEHKSAPDPYVFLQLLGYMVNGYQTQLKNFEKNKEQIKLQIIVPTLYYCIIHVN